MTRSPGSSKTATLSCPCSHALLLKTGAKIGDLCRRLAAGESLPSVQEQVGVTLVDGHIVQLYAFLCDFQVEKAEFLASVLALSLRAEDLILSVYAPILNWCGRDWEKGGISVAQANFISSFARNRLHALSTLSPRSNSRLSFVLATLSGDRHEGGILALSCLLRLRGHSTIYLGCNLPLKDLKVLDQTLNLTAICLSFTGQRISASEFGRFRGFRNRIVLGGQGLCGSARSSSVPGVSVIRSSGEEAVKALEILGSGYSLFISFLCAANEEIFALCI